jgi:hypothetical protein
MAAEQERLLAALIDGEEPPPGFDADRITATAQVLEAKKRRVADKRAARRAEAQGESRRGGTFQKLRRWLGLG